MHYFIFVAVAASTQRYSLTRTLMQSSDHVEGLLDGNDINYMNTVQILLGTPPQQLTMLFDINFPAPVVFQSNCFNYFNSTQTCSEPPFSVNQTFDYQVSTSFQNYTFGQNNTHWGFTSGYQYYSPRATDTLCIGDFSVPSNCFNSMILPVQSLIWNDWFQYVALSNINGVMGMSYWPSATEPQSFWSNMIAQGYNSTLAVSLLPTEQDYSWVPNAPNLTQTSSSVIVGQYNASEFVSVTSNQMIVNTSNANIWVFDVQLGFGYTNTSAENITEFYYNLTNATYNQVLIETAYPGIGLGFTQYNQVAATIKNLTYNLFKCNANRGGYCTAPVWCETFNGDEYASWNLTDIGFKIVFTANQTCYVKVPLFAFMRNGANPLKPTCNILMYATAPYYSSSPWIILGDAFLQQFFGEFAYQVNGQNWMTLTLTDSSLPTSFIGNTSIPVIVPEIPDVVPEPIIQPIPTPEPPQKTNSLTKVQFGLIYGAGAVTLLLIALITCYAFSSPPTRALNPYTTLPEDPEQVIYQMDRATLLRQARDKVYY